MTHSLTPQQTTQLHECLKLAQDPAHHQDANQTFAALRASISEPSATELLSVLWQEILTARRSAAFWQQISDVEKEMSERLAQNHMQLQQNYLRLMQEQ